MSEEKLNYKFKIPVSEIEDKIGCSLNGESRKYKLIVSPKEIIKVYNLSFMKEKVFYSLIRNIPIKNKYTKEIYPYRDAEINVYGVEPKGLKIGQKFALDKKLIEIMRGLEGRLFEGFLVKGISKMPPAQIYGLNSEGEESIAFYIPPISEIHGDEESLIDGLHRSKLCGSSGTTINAVHIRGSKVPLPFRPINWDECKIVSEKPPKEERYESLNMNLFRDLGAVGIDG